MLILDGPPLRLACDRCHKRKQRCTRTGINDNKPCERCREAGSQCVYSPPSRLGRPSNRAKRERQQIGTSGHRSRPRSNTTSPTSPHHPAHSFSLSASSVPVPIYMPVATNGRRKTRPKVSSQSMMPAEFVGFKPPSPSSVSSQFSDSTSSPSSYNFGSPSLQAMDAAGGNALFHTFQIPRSQPPQCHQQPVSGPMVPPPSEHHSGSLPITPEQHAWCPPPQNHSNNMVLNPPTHDDATLLLGYQNQQQQQQPHPQPPLSQSQSLYPVDLWPSLLTKEHALQLQASLVAPGMTGSDRNAYSRWKWSGQPVADPRLAMNLGIPVTVAVDGNQPMYYSW